MIVYVLMTMYLSLSQANPCTLDAHWNTLPSSLKIPPLKHSYLCPIVLDWLHQYIQVWERFTSFLIFCSHWSPYP
jgi:hypothetical protein